MKKTVLIVVIGVMSAQMSLAGLLWGSGANVINDFDGNPVATSESDNPIEGSFAQLIRITSGTMPYDFTGVGSGINTLNEMVMDIMFSGQYDPFPEPGTFSFQSSSILANSIYDGYYYVRVFDAPQATIDAWNQGTSAPIPSGAGYYFESGVYTYTHNETLPSTFNFGSGQTLNAIPEPTTMLLMAGGLFGMLALRRKRA